MKTLFHFRQLFLEQLVNIYEQDEIKSLFQVAVEEILGYSRIKFNDKLHEKLSSDQVSAFESILKELKSNKPIQYIVGFAQFYGEKFKVSSDTLIPRQETEELVDLIIKDKKGHRNLTILDIGTGTGCIAISLQKHLPSAKTTAVDISKDALNIARINAKRLNTEISFRNLDILEWELTFGDEKFDVIVSNPPYVTLNENNSMHANVLDFEPHSALFVPQESPLLFYDYISEFAKSHLDQNGSLYFEINQYLALETRDLLIKKGFKTAHIINDINNVPRILKASKN